MIVTRLTRDTTGAMSLDVVPSLDPMVLDALPDDVIQLLIPYAVRALGKPRQEFSSRSWCRLRSRLHFVSLSLISQTMKRAVGMYLADLCRGASVAAIWIQSQALFHIVRQRQADTLMNWRDVAGDDEMPPGYMSREGAIYDIMELAERIRRTSSSNDQHEWMVSLVRIFKEQPMGKGKSQRFLFLLATFEPRVPFEFREYVTRTLAPGGRTSAR
jgi:hypothetical protein